MIKVIKHENMGRSDRGWLHSLFHFSFAEYYKPDNIKFGALRVVNDDRFDPHGGFGMHPHDNMEIISYVVDGQLTHRDNLGNGSRLERGDVQYMSAGSGIMHSEYNDTNEPLRFLQIWILPDEKNAEPNYGDHRFDWEDRVGKWMPVASGEEGFAPIRIHQDMKVLVGVIGSDETLYYDLDPARQAYLIQIEGEGMVNGNELDAGDAAETAADGGQADGRQAEQDAAAQTGGAKGDASSGGASAGASASGAGTDSSESGGSSSGSKGGGSASHADSAGGTSSSGGNASAPAPDPDTVTVTVSVDSSAADGSVSGGGTFTFECGATAYDALLACGLTVGAENSPMGIYVYSIGGLAEKQFGGGSGWNYAVNGSTPGFSCGAYELSDGDDVRWFYVTG